MEEGTVSWLTVYYQLGSKVLHTGLAGAGARHSAQAYPTRERQPLNYDFWVDPTFKKYILTCVDQYQV